MRPGGAAAGRSASKRRRPKLASYVDALPWGQTDEDEARHRGLARDAPTRRTSGSGRSTAILPARRWSIQDWRRSRSGDRTRPTSATSCRWRRRRGRWRGSLEARGRCRLSVRQSGPLMTAQDQWFDGSPCLRSSRFPVVHVARSAEQTNTVVAWTAVPGRAQAGSGRELQSTAAHPAVVPFHPLPVRNLDCREMSPSVIADGLLG